MMQTKKKSLTIIAIVIEMRVFPPENHMEISPDNVCIVLILDVNNVFFIIWDFIQGLVLLGAAVGTLTATPGESKVKNIIILGKN